MPKKSEKRINNIGRRVIAAWLVGIILFSVLIGMGIILNSEPLRDEEYASQKRIFCNARVTEVLHDSAEADTWSEGRRLGSQLLLLEIISGEHKGKVFQGENYLSAYSNVDCKPGTRVIVRLDYNDNGDLYVSSIPNYDRGIVMAVFILVFAVILVAVGGKKGAAALLGLVYTLACLWFLLVPMILKGVQPVLASVIVVVLTTAASLILLSGLNRKTFCAVLGCVSGVVTAGVFAAIVSGITPINGFNMSEAEELVLRSSETGLHISGLLVSGILIASLGAVMDVAMSISSSCNELRELNPGLDSRTLFRSGMNIGRDAMGTMANTLILAFAGSSLNMLILFKVFNYPLIQIINSDAMVIEIIQGVAGSIGIILTVPLVAFISSRLLIKK
ncbi:MAG: YibE/F family protein [Oscillospiraceae bacterium]|nr:YibE/F family protein [Oscillospiraceae bacterium]